MGDTAAAEGERRSSKLLPWSKVLHYIVQRLGKKDTERLQDHIVKANYLNKDVRIIFSPNKLSQLLNVVVVLVQIWQNCSGMWLHLMPVIAHKVT